MNSSTKDGDMKKFLFDTNDFDQVEPEDVAPVYSEEQLLLAREQSHAQGKAEGIAETRAAQEEKISGLLEKVSAQVLHLASAEERREMEKSIDAAKLALRIAHKLMPQFAQQFSLNEVEHVILSAIDARRDEPRIAVSVPTAHLDALKLRVDAIALEKGYAGKVILIADDTLSEMDCRVEWADGGAEKIYARLFAEIENEFAKAISGMEQVINKEHE